MRTPSIQFGMFTSAQEKRILKAKSGDEGNSPVLQVLDQYLPKEMKDAIVEAPPMT